MCMIQNVIAFINIQSSLLLSFIQGKLVSAMEPCFRPCFPVKCNRVNNLKVYAVLKIFKQ